ncbi:hypothetical protein JKP88DRAFT_198883 [Tribonema minus]|uniref:Phospholipid-transporting ATPase n=1 Tax=Tribonema minus TaxID=303371 RepID=A0A836CFX1_9STRA|nr:hypothetical protein JKP88DRAFT_198883 [Tribonema minus]
MAELTASDVETGAQQEPRSPSAVAEAGGEQGGSYAGNSFKELSQRLHRRRRSSGSHHRKPKSNPKGWHRGKHRAEDLEARPNRIVNINAEQDFEFCTNFVKTSKYEPYSFLPLFLWEEFNPRTKIANVYFLFIAVLQVIPSITNTFGIPTMLLPLVFVVAVDAVFMVIEDVERHRADRRANSSPTAVWDAAAGKFRAVSWSEVHVGDILKIRNREAIPADVLLLSVAEPDPAAAAGICYVETKSLDGETNLKIRQVPKGLVGAVRRSAEAGALRGRVVMEHPNRLINNFAGTLVMAAGRGGAVAAAAPIDAEALLLRGCTLRNTRHALGLVLNTGMDTKIMMSMTAAPTKASRLSARVNREIKRMAVVMLAFCALGAALSTAWLARDSRDAWYLKGGADRYVEGQGDAAGELVGQYVIAFFYYMLLLNSFIPISLYVSMNFVRFFQAWFMNQDLEMYHEETDTPARVRTMNLNEDLGQVSHVFSDKTGTLTCNVMDFRKCSVGGKVYGRGITEIGRAALEIAGKEVPKEVLEAETLSRRVAAPHVNFYDPAIFADMHPQHGDGDGDNESAAAAEAQAQRLAAFFTALALCHTVIPEKLQDGEVVLSASSPDDEALVLGAKYFGFEFLDRADTTALIRRTVVHAPEGDIERYEVLHVLPFNSDRKRMSVIVRCPDGAIRLFCKGADTVMLPRLRGGAHRRWRRRSGKRRSGLARRGLRTLVVASAVVPNDKFAAWAEQFDDASGDLDEINKRNAGEPNRIEDLMDVIEMGLELLGSTAIEDKLQEGVPGAIASIMAAGIKVWVLTGDKEETAINIGVACQLIWSEERMDRLVINLKGANGS